MSEVILSGVDEAYAKKVRWALSNVPKERVVDSDDLSAEGALRRLADDRPVVVAFGPGLNGVDRFEATRQLVDLDPTIGILIIDDPTEQNVLKALEAGARAVLSPESGNAEIRKTFQRVHEAALKLRDHQALSERAAGVSRTIVVVSAKGGAGKTMVAVNLATAIALSERRRAAIVDLDLQFGDVSSALLLSPDHTIADAAAAVGRTSGPATALKVFLSRSSGSDLFVLCAPEDPATGEEIPAAVSAAIVSELSTEFPYVVVDSPAGLGETTLAVLEDATDIVILVDLDVASVRGGRKLVEALDLIGVREPKRHLVLNRSDSKVGLGVEEVELALGLPIDVLLPSSRAVPLSFNQGQPLVLGRPRHEFSRRIGELAARFVVMSATRGGGR